MPTMRCSYTCQVTVILKLTMEEKSPETSIGKDLWTQIIDARILGYTRKKMNFRMGAVQTDFEGWVRLAQMAREELHPMKWEQKYMKLWMGLRCSKIYFIIFWRWYEIYLEFNIIYGYNAMIVYYTNQTVATWLPKRFQLYQQCYSGSGI